MIPTRAAESLPAIHVGGLTLRGRVLAAPLCGITNKPFRVLAYRHGAGLAFTEMVKARAWVEFNRRTGSIIDTDPAGEPIKAVQIATGDPVEAAHTVDLAVRAGFNLVDLNLGCPAKKIEKSKCGVWLMSHPDVTFRTAEAMVREGQRHNLPITAKLRISLDGDDAQGTLIAKGLRDVGVQMISVHARAKSDVHKGLPDFEATGELKQALPDIPIIVNGGIKTPEDAAHALTVSGCDGVMIGRAALGNPWLFNRAQHFIDTGHHLPPPTLREVRDTLLWHFRALVEYVGEWSATRLIRRYAVTYLKGLPGSAEARRQFSQTDTAVQFETLVTEAFVRHDLDAASEYHGQTQTTVTEPQR